MLSPRSAERRLSVVRAILGMLTLALCAACEDPFVDPPSIVTPDASGAPSEDAGQSMSAWPNECPPTARCDRRFCWSTPVPVATTTASTFHDSGGATIDEPDGRFMYVARLEDGARTASVPFHRHVKLRVVGPGLVDRESARRIATTDYAGIGYTGPVIVAHDGLEMTFHSSRPDADYSDKEIYLSSRTALDRPWSAPLPIEELEAVSPSDFDAPLLLPDGRSLLFYRAREGRLGRVQRARATHGTLGFGGVGWVLEAESGQRILGASLSCDGWHLFYLTRPIGDGRAPIVPRVARILSLEPFTLAAPEDLPLPRRRYEEGGVIAVHETPDCAGLYFSSFTQVYYAEPCP